MGFQSPTAIEVTSTQVSWRGPPGRLTLCIRRPHGIARPPVLVFFHGGGFVHRDRAATDAMATLLALRLNAAVITPMYTMASEAPFPAASNDAYAAVAWAAGTAREARWDPRKLIVAGVECGGNLAAVAAMMARDRGEPAIGAQVLVTPMLDPTQSSPSMHAAGTGVPLRSSCGAAYRAYLRRAADRVHPYAAPACCSRVAGLPPALILTASDDPLRDEGEAYGAKLVAAGVTTQVSRLAHIDDGHGTWTEEAWAALTSFLAPHLGSSTPTSSH